MKLNTNWNSTIYNNLSFVKKMRLWLAMKFITVKELYFWKVLLPYIYYYERFRFTIHGWSKENLGQHLTFSINLQGMRSDLNGKFKLIGSATGKPRYLYTDMNNVYEGWRKGMDVINTLKNNKTFSICNLEDDFLKAFPVFNGTSKKSERHERILYGFKLAYVMYSFH